MRKDYSVEFKPLYYMGWIIQPTIEGWEVYDREDSSRYRGQFFESAEEAMDYIEEQVGWEGR